MTNGGYTKMRGKANGRTISMDFSDLAFSPPPPPAQDVLRPPSPPRSKKSPRSDVEAGPRGQEAAGGEMFGVILSRTSSYSASHRFAANSNNYERGASAGGGQLHAAVRRAFSMRKLTSSPAEGYCRIHDTVAASDVAEDHVVDRELTKENVRKKKKKAKKEGRVLRACKRLFGF